MLIIGSRALQFHFPEYKKQVNDWDFIGTESEIKKWLIQNNVKNIFFEFIDYINIRLYYTTINGINYEFQVSHENSSNQDYLNIENNKEEIINYASIEVLYSILGSFIHREEIKEKHRLDYQFLKNILKNDNLISITNKRKLENDIRFNSLK